MGSKITRKSWFTKPSEIVLLVAFFISVNLLILSYFQERTLRTLENDQTAGRDKSPESVEMSQPTMEAVWEGQILTIEEDGRFGNLLLELATLIIIGKRLNTPVQILPQVGRKLEKFLSNLPAPTIDYRKTCVCTYCTDCVCPVCTKWTKIPSWTFLANPTNQSHVMLKWFNSDLILQNVEEMRDILRPLLRPDVVERVQEYLRNIQREEGGETTFVSIHVRRTDYIQFVEKRYKGQEVGAQFFLDAMEEFLRQDPRSVFLVTSDDLDWCRQNLIHPRVIFPTISSPSDDPTVTDFILLTQTNHSIYDYGSFAFWGAVLAGGKTIVADGYSQRVHPVLAAIKKFPPNHWKTKNVKTLK